MLTFMAILIVFMMVAFFIAIIQGLIALSPILLILVLLPVIDYFVLKLIFKRRKKKD